MALRQAGLSPEQVTLVDMAPAEQVTAMAKKDIDAAVAWEPWIHRMVHEANARVVATEGDLGIYTDVGSYSVRRDWLRTHRETAVRFLQALLLAHDALQKDPMIGVQALANEMAISETWAEAIYRDAPPPRIGQWTNIHYRYSLVNGSVFQRRLGYLAAFLLDEGIISKPVEVRFALDATVIAEAMKTPRQGR
jgi:ABC-type nitrate/sulfonate/bicarbonate transport system substrate-binding protein